MIELINWNDLSTDTKMRDKWSTRNILDLPFSTGIFDVMGKTITNHNSVAVSGSRASFNGSNQWLEFEYALIFNFWNNNFVFKTLYKPTNLPRGESFPKRHALYHDGPGESSNQNAIYVTATKLEVGRSDSGKILSVTHGFSAGTEYEIKLTRVGSLWTFYKNGVSLGSTTYSETIPTYGNTKTIGCEERGGGDFLNATLGNYSISNIFNIAVYSESSIIADYDYALKLVANISSLNEYISSGLLPLMNLTGQVTFKTKIAASRTGQNFKISLINGGTGGDNTQTDFTPNVQSAGTTYNEYSFDISDVADSAKNAINQIKITVLNADAENTVYVGKLAAYSEDEGVGGGGISRSRMMI